MKLKTQIILATLIAVKIFICLIFIFQLEIGSLVAGDTANASEPPKDAKDNSKTALNVTGIEKADLNFVEQKMELLKKKEQEMEKREAEMITFQEEINIKIEKLTKLRNEIKAQIATKEIFEKQKIKHLIKVYSAMKPQSAAGLLEKQDKVFAIELLSQMKGETVGEILTYVEKEKAAKLIEGLASRK